MDFKEQYFEIWKSAWDFHKKWCNNGGTDETWGKIIEESESIANRYKGSSEHQFAEDLMLLVISELERKGKTK